MAQDEVYAELRQHRKVQRDRNSSYAANRAFSQQVCQLLLEDSRCFLRLHYHTVSFVEFYSTDVVKGRVCPARVFSALLSGIASSRQQHVRLLCCYNAVPMPELDRGREFCSIMHMHRHD